MFATLALILALDATFRPAHPTVGDPVTIDFPGAVVLDPSPDYEVVSRAGSRVVVRTFAPRPVTLSGIAGDVRFGGLVLPVRSVLEPRQEPKPSPLAAPRVTPYPSALRWLLIATATAALLSWLAVIVLARRLARPVATTTVRPPAETYRAALLALRRERSSQRRWERLSEVTRHFLDSTSPALGLELTTTELLETLRSGNIDPFARAADGYEIIATILRQGDLEKFSPWGAAPEDFVALIDRALPLAVEPEGEKAAA